MINSYLKFRQKLTSCGRSLLWGSLAAALMGIATPEALAFLHITALEVEEDTYFPEDPVPMLVAITSTHDDFACYEVHVHLTPDVNFRTESDHMLHVLSGSIGPGETVVRNWTQMMPGNLPGTFFLNAEVTTCHDTLPAMSSPNSRLAPGTMIQTAKITLAPETYPETSILSTTRGGTPSNGLSEDASISDDGRYVAFASRSTTLLGVARDEDGEIITDDDDNPVGLVGNDNSDIYVKDHWTGEIERLSVPLGASDANGDSYLPRISADGRWVVFHSNASNLVPGITNGLNDVFLKDREGGELIRISIANNGAQGNQASQNASVSGDGRWVVFESEATNLIEGDTNSVADIFLYDREERRIVRRINVNDDGVQAQGGHSRFPRISADGRHIVFESRARNLTNDADNGLWEIYVHDRDANGTNAFDEPGGTRTRRLSVGYDRDGNPLFADGHSRSADLTNDGRLVVFQSESTQMAARPAEGAIVLPGRSAEAELRWSENEPAIGTIQLEPSALAVGSIGFNSNPSDGDTVTIGDGLTSLTFEFDGPFLPDGVAAGNIQVIIGGDESATRNALVRAINSGFDGSIEAAAAEINGQPGIHLQNLDFGPPEANEPIDVSGAPTLVAEGMSGAEAPAGSLQADDEIVIDHGSRPVTIRFYNEGSADPTDYDAGIVGVALGRTSNETAENLFETLYDLGYHEFDGWYLPNLPEQLLPPLMENPLHGDMFVFTQGTEGEPGYFETTFTFVDDGPQFDPNDPLRVLIGATPEETRGNLLRNIMAQGVSFDELPAIFEPTGDGLVFGEIFDDGPAQGAIALTSLPEEGHNIVISDGDITTTFRFDDERELTEEEEEGGFVLPPFEVTGPGLVRIYLPEGISLGELTDALLAAIAASELEVSAAYGESPDLEAEAILLTNNNVGEHGNVDIILDPYEAPDEEEEPSEIVEADWARAVGMSGGFITLPAPGDRVVFYPENLLHPSVIFEFVADVRELSSDADFAVPLAATGAVAEANLLDAILRSGLPWLTVEGPDEAGPASVRIRSILARGDGTIAMDFSTDNPDAFVCLGDCPGDRDGRVHMPYHGGLLTLDDGVNHPVTFEFTYDGSVSDDANIPVRIAAVGALTRDNLINAINQTEHLEIRAEGESLSAEDPAAPDELVVRLINANRGTEIAVDHQHLGPIEVSIVDAGGWNPRPGEAFRIGDANGNFETFEFVLSGQSPEEGRIAIETVAASNDSDLRTIIRDRISAAIKGAGLALIVTDGVEDNSPAVFLESAIPGPAGNVAIQVLTSNPSFTVRGMAGGAFLGTGRDQVYLVDRDANRNGIFDEPGDVTVELISVTEEGLPASDLSSEPVISGNGRFVVFRTLARDLLPRTVVRSDGEVFPNRRGGLWPESDEIVNFTDVDPFSDLYVRDREEGTNRRITVNRFGEALVGHRYTIDTPRSSRGAAISYDGQFIAYESDDDAYNQEHRGGIGDGRIRGGGLAHTTTNRNTLDHNRERDIFLYDRRFPTDAPTIPGEVILSLSSIVPVDAGPDGTPTVTVGSPVDIQADVSDILPGRTPAFVQFFANGSLIGVANQPVIPGGSVFAIRWVPGAATTYRVVAVATDSFGRSLPMSDELTIVAKRAENQVQPNVSVYNPPIDGDLVPDNAFPLTTRSEWPFAAVVSSGTHSIEEVEFVIRNLTGGEVVENFIDNSLGGISIGTAQKEPSAADTNDNFWRLNFDLAAFGPSGLPAGYYAVWAVARDSSGNLGASQQVPLLVSPAILDRPSLRLTAMRTELTREEYNRYRVQVDTNQGQIVPGGEVYLFANSQLISFEGDENPQTSRPFEWDGWALYSGTWNFMAVARDNAGNTSISNIVRVVVHPFGNIVGNPSDPNQSTAFIFQMYEDLFLLPDNAPSTAMVRNFVRALESGAMTRGEVIADLMTHREFDEIRWVIAAYLTVLQDPPRFQQLVEGVELLRGGGDDDTGGGGDDDEEGGGLRPGVPVRLPALISDILNGDDFWYEYIRTGVVDYDETNQVDIEDLIELVHNGRGTYEVTQGRIQDMQQMGRTTYLANLTESRLRDSSLQRDVARVALILLLLQRDTSLAEARSLPGRTEDAAEFIVSSPAFVNRHDGPMSFFVLRERLAGEEPSLFGTFDEQSGMFVKESAWFGLLNDQYFNYGNHSGWIKHTEHEWVFLAPNSLTENGAWIWDNIQQDWLWTSEQVYPLLFSDDDQVWLYYYEGGSPASREFRVHDGTSWSGTRRVNR